MRAVDVLKRKKHGQELSSEEIHFLIDGLTRGKIPRYQLSAFLMAVYFRGMTDEETAARTWPAEETRWVEVRLIAPPKTPGEERVQMRLVDVGLS